MLPSAHDSRFSRDSLPACLCNENPNRLVSLWDIVNVFDCARLQILLKKMHLVRGLLNADSDQSAADLEEWVGTRLKEQAKDVPADVENMFAELRSLEADLGVPVKEVIEELRTFCESAEFQDTLYAVRFAGHHLRNNPSLAELRSEIRHLEEALFLDIAKRKFLHVDPDRVRFLEQDELFGAEVKTAFPSAAFDIREAGNCLAADNCTAAVFHLMRAVEWGLRALCVDLGLRRLRTKNRKTGKVRYLPLGWTDWETILNQLKERVTRIVAMSKRGPKKQLSQEFYYPAILEIEAMKDAWRNHVMHTRREYTWEDAQAVFGHVRRFMVKLAERVSEC